MSDQLLTPTTTRLRQTHAADRTHEAKAAVEALHQAGLSLSEMARLCWLSPGNRNTLAKLRDGGVTVRSTTAQAIIDGHARYRAGDRSFLRRPENVQLPRPIARPVKAAPAPGPKQADPGHSLASPGLRDRLLAKRLAERGGS